MGELGRIYWWRLACRWTAVLALVWLASAMLAELAQGRLGAVLAGSSGTQIASEPAALAAGMAAPALMLAGLGIAAVKQRSRDRLRRDPRRQFSPEQCREGLDRAGGICELETARGRRCTRAATHGLHFYPWSGGGSTTMQNFVAVCARCTRFRKPRFPSPRAQRRLEERRRKYFPPGTAVLAGERNPVSGRTPAWLRE